jgi:CubicO group peptidase (beta-lactamase class C family)
MLAPLCVLSFFSLLLQAPAHTPDSGLVGIWGSEATFGPLARGELTLTQTAQGWTARIAGFELAPRTSGDSLWLSLPGQQGQLRGRLAADGDTIRGFWIQPPGAVNGVSYAFPVRLAKTLARKGTRSWRGAVEPLDERFSLYLIVTRAPDGSLVGSFHNPEANSRGGAAAFHLERSGSTVRFIDASRPPGQTVSPILGSYDSTQATLTIPWTDIGRSITLTRRDPHDAVGLYPRSPPSPSDHYRAPQPDADGWTTASAREVGLDSTRLAALVQHVSSGDPALDTTPLIQSILIARHGKLVLDEYFFGFEATRPHDTRSASKTFASVLVGAAMLHGAAIAPATPAFALFAADTPFTNPDARKKSITLANLMTHSTGLACDDNGDPQPGNEDVMQGQQAQPDWYRYTLDLPVRFDPGAHYAYCSATMNLVGGVVASAEHAWLPALFDRWVAAPLQFGRYYVNLMPTGQAYFGGGMHLLPRDLLKLGVAYLNGGIWNGHRIVSRQWVAQSTAPVIDTHAGTSDGYAWHLHTLTLGDKKYTEYEANGNGGQYLIVLPALDMAVVITGADYGRYGIWRRWRDDLVPQYVIAAVTR